MAKKDTKSAQAPKSLVNRRARYDYELLDSWEAGIALVGSEVKSIWLGRVNMTDAFCKVINGELWLLELDIEPYEFANTFKPERRRDRKLLLHKKEIAVIERKSMEKGFAILPTRLYFKNGKVKVEVSLGRGKKQYDKRAQEAKDQTRREADRVRKGDFL
jgi:SsrA-binding protein